MAVRNVLRFRGAGNILNFKVLFCVDGKLLCKAFSLCRQPLLHFFRLVQIAAKALSFAVVLAVEVVQDPLPDGCGVLRFLQSVRR